MSEEGQKVAKSVTKCPLLVNKSVRGQMSLQNILAGVLISGSLVCSMFSNQEQPQANSAKYMITVDFSKPSTAKRLCLIEVKTNKTVYCTESAHGTKSGGLYATSFSNVPESHRSSLGTYRLGDTYYGKHGLSIKLEGLDKTNSNALKRYIVIHEASYIGKGKTGRSWGCFAVPKGELKKLMKYYQKGMLLKAYR